MLVSRPFDRRLSLAAPVALVLGGSLLMAIGARLSIHLGVVPITFQPLALALVVALLGTRLSVAAMAAYLVEGALGAPVFAGGSGGPGDLLGPTAGYLWSYPLAAFAIGALRDAGFARTVVTRLAANLAGLAVVYACGAGVLSAFVGPAQAFALGVAPFVVLDLAKMLLAALPPLRRTV